MFKNNVRLSCILILIVILSCAHQLSPGGGPADTAGPKITVSIPSNGSLNVPKTSKISILFSEWISKRNLKVVSIYPPLKHELKIKKNRLEIIPEELMADSQTYHVIISSVLQDLHGNAFSESFSVVFSTGPFLDSGTISGCIITQKQNNTIIGIALFNNNNFHDSGYSGTPSYKIETDSLGNFNLNFLKKGYYRIAGFLQQPVSKGTNETVFIPEDSVVQITTIPDTIKLYSAIIDTAFPRINAIKVENRKYAIATWNKVADTSIFKISCKIAHADSLARPIPFKSVFYGTSNRLAILPEKPFNVAPWKLIYSISRVFDTVTFVDTIPFNSTDIADTTKPEIRTSKAPSRLFLTQAINLLWSEPVKIDTTLFLFDSLGDTVNLECNSQYNDTTKLTLSRALNTGSLYKLILLNRYGSDLNKNSLKARDSTDTVIVLSFITPNPDSIAISIQGNSNCGFSSLSRKLKWVYYPTGKPFHYICVDDSNSFLFDSIPAGTGKIGIFADKNNNDLPDPGSLIPWRSPEPYFLFPDTVEARPRWDVEGIILKDCKNCTGKIF